MNTHARMHTRIHAHTHTHAHTHARATHASGGMRRLGNAQCVLEASLRQRVLTASLKHSTELLRAHQNQTSSTLNERTHMHTSRSCVCVCVRA